MYREKKQRERQQLARSQTAMDEADKNLQLKRERQEEEKR